MICLDILIPTYNRNIICSKLVKKLVFYIDNINANIKINILVQDNGSDIKLKLNLSRNYLSVIHLPINIGADSNFLSLIEASASDYFWIFGDDDTLTQIDFKLVIDEIIQNEPDILFIPKSKSYKRVYTSGCELLDKVLVHSTFITSHIFKNVQIHFDFTISTNDNLRYWHYFLLLYCAANKSIYLGQCNIEMRTDSSGYYDLLNTWYDEYDKILNEILLSRKTKLLLSLDRYFTVLLPFIYNIRNNSSNSSFVINDNIKKNENYLIRVYKNLSLKLLKLVDLSRKLIKLIFYFLFKH